MAGKELLREKKKAVKSSRIGTVVESRPRISGGSDYFSGSVDKHTANCSSHVCSA